MSIDECTTGLTNELVTRIRALEKSNARIRHVESQSRMLDRQRRANQLRLLAKLTPREREIAELLIKGRTVKQIAYDLGRSVNTVHVHRARILKKTNAQDVPNLIRIFSATDAAPNADFPDNDMC